MKPLACKKCGAPVTTERRVVQNGLDHGEVLACDPCWEAFCEDVEVSRRDYATMVAAGLPEELALRFIEGDVGLA